MRHPVIPAGMEGAPIAASPAIRSGDHLFLTGMTGSGPDGAVPPDPAVQFHAAFEKIAAILAAADLTLDAVVEMTSYHLSLAATFDVFDAVCRARFAAPYPAWTAVEVAGLRRPGALVEIRAVAHIGRSQSAKTLADRP